MSLAESLNKKFEGNEFTLKQAYEAMPDKPKETVRARIYDNLGIYFERLGKGVYKATVGNDNCVLLNGDGRDLSMLNDSSIDCIITDHPWEEKNSNKGGNRNFTSSYDTFKYKLDDFKEKARVLKEGSFLIEMVPAENENNFEYLYEIKKMAEECGFKYYAKVPWKKGTFISNTGRKSKNTEDILIFSKGKARNLRPDVKKTNSTGKPHYMSGTAKMLPTEFDVQAVSIREKIHQSEKPIELWLELIPYITREHEKILDQFAGSCNVGIAALILKRKAIMIEKNEEILNNILNKYNKIPN